MVLGFLVAQAHSRLFRARNINIHTFRTPGALVETGLFRRTRNPMYLGMLTMLVGASMMLGTATALAGPAFFFWLANVWYIPFEEAAMLEEFGERYDDYRTRVRRWW